MPEPSARRDVHALVQGAHLLLIGGAGCLAVVLAGPPDDASNRIPMFVGWSIAFAMSWGGFSLIRRGRNRRVYRSSLRWIATGPLALFWLTVLLVATLALYIRTTGHVPGFVVSAVVKMSGGSMMQEADPDQLSTPRGWLSDKPGRFSTTSGLSAVVTPYTSYADFPAAESARSAEIAELAADSLGDDLRGSAPERIGLVHGNAAWRVTAIERADGGTTVYDSVWVVDTEREQLWNVMFGRSGTRGRNDLDTQLQFLARLDTDVRLK